MLACSQYRSRIFGRIFQWGADYPARRIIRSSQGRKIRPKYCPTAIFCPNGHISLGTYKRPPSPSLGWLALPFSHLHCWPWWACPSSWFLPWFLHILEGKEWGDLDLHLDQSNPSLCEGIPLDLDLGVLCEFPLFFLSYSPISFCSFGGVWEWRICHLHLVHRFEFSTKIRGSESEELITLGFLEP